MPTLQIDPYTLYRDHHGWLYGWLRKKLGCPQHTADLTHDTFVRVLTRTHELSALDEPRAYLTTIAHGLVIDHWRRQRIERAYLKAMALLPEQTEPSPESRLLILEALTRIDLMLDGLKPRIRTAFLLAQLDGLSCPQIAQRIGCSRATVERYLTIAFRHCYTLAYGD